MASKPNDAVAINFNASVFGIIALPYKTFSKTSSIVIVKSGNSDVLKL